MTPLALTLTASPRETPTSYVSRLAARNLSSDLWGFCLDVGLNFPALSTGDPASVAHLCNLAGLPPQSFDRTTVLKTSSMRYLVGGEVMNTETLDRGTIRLCPVCISEALKNGASPWQVIHEAHWQIVQVRRCLRHGALLTQYRTKSNPASRFDVTALIRKMDPKSPASCEKDADALDYYLTSRAYGKHRDNWCNRLQIPALIKAAEAFGILLNHGKEAFPSAFSPEIRRDAMLTGFDVLSGGEDGIFDALGRFARRTPSRGGDQPYPRHGVVQSLLGSNCKLREDLDPVRDVVRRYLLESFPYKPGSVVLGRRVTERRVHSIRSACRAIGVRRSLLEKMLIEGRLAERNISGHLKLRTVLSVDLIASLHAEKTNYLNQQQTAHYLGCSFAMFKQLSKAGLLIPAEGDKTRARKGFHRRDLDEFLQVLGAGAKRFRAAPPQLCSLELATRKANCSVPDIVGLIIAGRLNARGRLSDRTELDQLLICPDELKRAMPRSERTTMPKNDVMRLLRLPLHAIDLLRGAGYLETIRAQDPISRVTREFYTVASVNRFIKKYASLGVLRRERNDFLFLCQRHLNLIGVSPAFILDGWLKIYKRSDLPPGFESKVRSLRKTEAADLVKVKPRTIIGIKKLARKYEKEHGMTHAVALKTAAMQAT
ncbi:TniQ family protein [Paracoccus caeni]|uniref:TniQ family protein n=1 Tax=Paracoccus caeni TaxID=657651 RepID=A0A934W2S9_9RHOB|nr:TniQ family protein [Paracoccus caeni]MBK4218084.1 TniQ family protein [Paracoccus caeni]